MQGRQATHLLSLSQGCLGAVQLPPGERQLWPAIPRSSSLPGREGGPVLSILQGGTQSNPQARCRCSREQASGFGQAHTWCGAPMVPEHRKILHPGCWTMPMSDSRRATHSKRPQLLRRAKGCAEPPSAAATPMVHPAMSRVGQSMPRCCRAARFSRQLTCRRPSRSWMRSCRASLSGTATPFSWGPSFVCVALLAFAGPADAIRDFRG